MVDPPRHTGVDIRALRLRRGLTLKALAEAVGRSVGWLSQVERGVSEPAIRDLRAIAAHFDVPLSFFFRHDDAPERERGVLVRCDARASLGNDEEGLIEHLLSPDLSGEFEMLHCRFEPGARCDWRGLRDTEEGGYLIDGELQLWIGDVEHRLGAGDSFRVRRERYRWANPGTSPCNAVWVIAPPVY